MKKFIYTVFCLFAMTATFCSCSSDDDNTTPPPPAGGAVTPPASYEAGWSGNFEDGTAHFTFERPDYDYDDEESDVKCDFYSFDFENGICTDAKYCIEFNDSRTANFYASLIQSGEFLGGFDDEEDDKDGYYDDEDDDYGYDDEYDYGYDYSLKALKKIKEVATAAKTRAGYSDFAMTVFVTNNFVYIPLDNYKGKKAMIIKNGIGTTIDVPEDFVYGEYNAAKGEYTCDSVLGVVSNGKTIQYKVKMTFTPERYVETYVTTVTMPNQSWATMQYEALLDQVESIGRIFGVSPELEMNDNVITLKAITRYDITNPELAQYAQDVTEEQMLQVLKYIDISNSQPMLRFFAAE